MVSLLFYSTFWVSEGTKEMVQEPIIKVNNLTMAYGNNVIMDNISFDVLRGQTFVILGGSGCGKSTLLKHMIGLYEPTQGQTYSLVLMGYAYTFDAMSEIDISTCGHLGTGYRNTITNMGRAFQEEVINYDDRILVRPIDDFDKLLLFSASESDFHPVRITEFDFEGIVQAAEQISSQYVMQLRSRMDWSIGNHDACILIPWSPIVTAMIE